MLLFNNPQLKQTLKRMKAEQLLILVVSDKNLGDKIDINMINGRLCGHLAALIVNKYLVDSTTNTLLGQEYKKMHILIEGQLSSLEQTRL